MVATHIKKVKHCMLHVTGVYLRDITNTVFFFLNFSLECESSARLALLLRSLWNGELIPRQRPMNS